jgi:hypothetical protein
MEGDSLALPAGANTQYFGANLIVLRPVFKSEVDAYAAPRRQLSRYVGANLRIGA